jgi:hypothetical protein
MGRWRMLGWSGGRVVRKFCGLGGVIGWWAGLGDCWLRVVKVDG